MYSPDDLMREIYLQGWRNLTKNSILNFPTSAKVNKQPSSHLLSVLPHSGVGLRWFGVKRTAGVLVTLEVGWGGECGIAPGCSMAVASPGAVKPSACQSTCNHFAMTEGKSDCGNWWPWKKKKKKSTKKRKIKIGVHLVVHFFFKRT